MAVRLRPQSAAWMAPHALAAQLTAQTGQIAGQGVAGLLGGIAQGVGAFTQKREARRAEAINESRYQDALSRQDRNFQYGAAKDQLTLLEDYLKGAEVEVALSAMSSPTGAPDPSKVQNLRTVQSSAQALRAQAAKIGGVQAANVPPMPEAPPAPVPTGQMPGVQERLAKTDGFEALSVPELETISAGLSSEAEAIKSEMDAMLKVGGTKAAAMMASKRTEFADKSRDAAIASAVLKRKMESEKLKSKQAEADIEAGKQIKVKAEDTKAKKADEAAAIATLQESLKAKGIDVTLPGDLESARKEYEDAVIKAPIRKEKKAQFDAKREDAATRFDRVMKVRERGVKVQEDRANKPSDKDPNEQKVKLFKMHLAASKAASDRYDFADAEAEDIKANLILKELEDAYSGQTPSASAYPSWLPSDPAAKSEWDALSPEAKQKVINQRGR